MSDSVALVVVAFFGILAFFAWLLILILICGGIWWYKSSFFAFAPCIDFSLFWRPSTPSILPEVEKITKMLDKEVVETVDKLQTEKINNETLKSLQTLENDLKQAEKNIVHEEASLEKDFNKVFEKSNTLEFFKIIEDDLFEQIKNSMFVKHALIQILDHSYAGYIPEGNIKNLLLKLPKGFYISNIEKMKYNGIDKFTSIYTIKVENTFLIFIRDIIVKARELKFSKINFENFVENDVNSYYFTKHLEHFDGLVRFVFHLTSKTVEFNMSDGKLKLLKIDYLKLSDESYRNELFENELKQIEGVEECKTK
jgi:hypothetical protein